MIRIKQPALVVHAHDVPGYKYQMKWTWKMLPGAAARDIVNWILHANNGQFGAQKQRLEYVIINCHGAPGSLFIGGTGSPALDIKSVSVFSALQGCDIGAIWLVACEVANQQGVATGGVGKTFCADLAKTAGCDVIASATIQHVNLGFYLRGCPWGCIDDFEGLTYRFKSAGGHLYYVS